MANPRARSLPPLLFLTDPARTPQPWHQAARLPAGAGVVFRGFGRPDALEVGRRLAEVCRARGLVFLVGADPDLAVALAADGVHLPERQLAQAEAVRAGHPGWLLTGAVHSARALDQVAALDAALASPVFPSASPSAGPPLGVETLAQLAAASPVPVYALGGVTEATAPALRNSGVCGLAAIGAI